MSGPVSVLMGVPVNGSAVASGWRMRALCREVDPELFFPEQGESAADAVRVCMRCEVRAVCAADALSRGERFGVWGGLTERQRRAMTRAARRSAAGVGEAA